MAPQSDRLTTMAHGGRMPSKSDHRQRGGDRHDLRHRHPVEAVHEIHQIDEPQSADDERHALDPPRQKRHDAQFAPAARKSPPRPRAPAAGIAARRNRDECRRRRPRSRSGRRRRTRLQAAAVPASPDAENNMPHRHHDRRRDDRNAAALRRRDLVRGARIGAGQRVTLEQRTQDDDQRGADECRNDDVFYGDRGTANIANSAFIQSDQVHVSFAASSTKILPPTDCSDVDRGSEKRVRLAG